MKIKKITKIILDKSVDVYDLTVDKYHNFLIGNAGIVSHNCSYIHGDSSLIGVLVGMAQRFVGSNNIPLIKNEGNFGSRWKPVASAARYIGTSKELYLNMLFMKDDEPVLIEQTFEGDIIEPKYYVPLLPLILVNGSEGISIGYAQKILPRNPLEIYEVIKHIIKEEQITEKLLPYYNGFTGKILEREEGGFEIQGTFKKMGMKLIIDELPIGYDLKSYNKVLQNLEDKKVISSYKDLTDTKKDKFLFEIKMKDIDILTDDEILDKLKLIKRVSENFTVMDENNKVCLLKDQFEILNRFVNIRLEYYQKRKDYHIQKIETDLKILANKLKFIKGIITNEIIINKKSKLEIEAQLVDFDKFDDSYDYLLKMQIYSLTSEKLENLIEEYKNKGIKLKELKKKGTSELYLEDLEILFKNLS